jgi:hypothetical protein
MDREKHGSGHPHLRMEATSVMIDWVSFLGPITTIMVCAVGGLITFGTLKERSTRNAEAAAAAGSRAEAADIRAAQVGKDLADLREHIAREYASREMVRVFEERIIDAINRLADRLDDVFKERARRT